MEPRRRGRPSEGARESLLAAATELFTERDYELVTTEDVLERSDVSRGALYHHFPTKLELFRAVWEDSERRLIARLATDLPADITPFGALMELARRYLRAAESDVELRRIGLGQSRKVLGWDEWREGATQLGLGLAIGAVRAAVEAGELPPEDPETMAVIVLGATIEGAMLVVSADDPAAARRRSEAVVVAILEGLHR